MIKRSLVVWMPFTKGISYEIPVNEFVTFLMKLNNNYYNKFSNCGISWSWGRLWIRSKKRPCSGVEWEQNALCLLSFSVFLCYLYICPGLLWTPRQPKF